MCLNDQRRSSWSDDNSLRAIRKNSWALDSITYPKILEFVDWCVLPATFKVHFTDIKTLTITKVLRLDLFELLINRLFQTFKCLPNSSYPHIVDYDISIWQSKTKLPLMVFDKSLAERPIITIIFLFRLFFRWFDYHQGGFRTTIPQIQIFFKMYLSVIKTLISQPRL